jgi:ipoprotein LpqH
VGHTQHRVAAALVVIATASGCATEPTAERIETGRITVDGTTHTTGAVSCEQYEWSLIIRTSAGPGHARAFLQLGGERPAARTVSLANFDGLNGVAGEDVDASAAAYTMTGMAEGSDQGTPGQTRTVPFRMEAPC